MDIYNYRIEEISIIVFEQKQQNFTFDTFLILIMKKILAYILCLAFAVNSYAQLTANFTIRDARKMCYTGDASRNTTATFKNNSTDGDYWYVWNYGDGSADSVSITTKKTENGKHEYKTDGLYSVSLLVIDPSDISIEISSRKILNVEYISAIGSDSVSIAITYKLGSTDTTEQVHIASSKFAKTRSNNCIEVFSPYVVGSNFSYEIDDPSSTENKAALESFVYILSVNTENFTPHDKDVWTYYWSIYNDKALVKEFHIDSTEYRYTFPKENYDPGYTVTLKIALDSSKFDAFEIENNELQECVASQSMIIKVTDYFFSDSTRTENDIEDRETSIPNVFTPNGDGENDVFYFNTNGIDIFTIWIYNNNGTLVYKQKEKTIYWTGNDNSGHECPPGTYFYVVKSDNKDKRHNTAGHIQLFR